MAPYAWINGPYVAKVGEAVSIDGSGSYAGSGALIRYEWDFDGDGTYDQTTATPHVTHRYRVPVRGQMALRVTDMTGQTATAETHISVTADGDEVPSAADNCPGMDNPGQEDVDGDGIGDVCDDTPGWPTQDRPGVSEGN